MMMTINLSPLLHQSVAALKPHLPQPLRAVIVLGSGLGGLATLPQWRVLYQAPYSAIAGFPTLQSDVAEGSAPLQGHAGQLMLAQWEGLEAPVALLCGRLHAYEGYTLQQVVHPLRTLALLGAKTLLLTNAAGSLNPQWGPGTLMSLSDQLNLLGDSPLRGPNVAALGPRFVDMSEAFCPQLRHQAQAIAKQQGFELPQGVYAGLMGPAYETPAEVRMLQALGAHAVGMSTVAEVLAARHAGLRVAGFSCLTNWAAGLSPEHLNHEEVVAMGQNPQVQERLQQLVLGLLLPLLQA
jgi:purine-nucleoside phosphorylase